MEDFLDDIDIIEEDDMPIEKIAASLKPFEEPPIIHQSIQEVLGVSSDIDEEDERQPESSQKIQMMS